MLINILRGLSIRPVVFLLCSVFFLGSCATKEENVSIEDIKKEIIELEKKALDEWANGSTSNFALNFAADATYFDDIAAQEGIEGIENLKKYFASLEGKVPKHTYELINPKIQVYGDIAILTMWYKGTLDSQVLPAWKATSVYQLKADTWKVIHANWSLIEQQESAEQEN